MQGCAGVLSGPQQEHNIEQKGVGKGEASKNMCTLIQSNKCTLDSEKRKHQNTENSNPGNMEKVRKEGGPGMNGRSQ